MLTRSSARYWSSAAATCAGNIRVQNEDTYLMNAERGLWAVADGMGGHQQGWLASQLVTESLLNIPWEPDLDKRRESVIDALQWANFHLSCERTLVNPRQIIGSTIMTLLAQPGRATCIWAGDSRCYLLRRGVLFQISEDHSLVQQWVNTKRITPEAALQHPLNNVVTRAVGVDRELVLESAELQLYPDDMLLLCTDGLYRELSTGIIIQCLSTLEPGKAVQMLMQYSLSGTARDNLTAVVVRNNS
ncbi:PP2C family protein-serine/threonine phosphatase [Tolumonas lignilytica]|uniref:PP2C family protein-serine/threonine phosphatase n=1 Tax=Tolumonas lignilytica TaxID=1283284 RepID=UPI0004660060|nr:PP2C family serine/threonine-protein phosphatase [Tolumonas lignilytica]